MKSKTKTSSANGTGKAIDSRPELEAQDELTIQLYIKTLEGITIPIKCKPNTDTIADLKREIFLKEGIPIQDQILIYSAKTLEDNQLIKDYGINGSIHLVQKLKQHQQTETPTQDELTRHLYITTIAGKKITIDYNPKTDTIAHLKNEIFRKEGIPIEDQLLTIAGQELIDSRLIEEYEAQKIESIRLLSSAQNQATEATSEKKSAQLQIQTLTGTEFLIEYNPETDTIAHLKSEIFRKAGIPIEEQALLFAGKKLIDSQLIKEYNINHIVRLVQKLKQHEQTETPTQDELTSQLFIKTLEGITIPIKCKPNTDTIADLKREIFLKEGIPIQDQILIYSAKTLEDNQLIKNYGINGSIHLVQKLKQHQQTETPKQDELTLQVFVQTLEGITIPILYKPYTDTIADLKSEIFRKKGIPIEEQMLISANKVLIDSELIIDYGVNEEIHLVQKLKQHQQTETPTQEVIQEAEKNIATLRGLIAQWKSKTEDLTIRNEPEAYKAANAVYTALNDRSEAYFAKPTKENFIALKTAFENSLDENKNNNRKTLETHRGVKELLGNIVLAIIGVGVLYLIAAVANKAINGRFTFFKTESEELIEKTEKGLKNQNGPSA